MIHPVSFDAVFFIKGGSCMNIKKDSVVRLVQKSMLLALAIVLMLIVRFPLLPAAKFLEYDLGDIPVIIATLFFGIPSGVLILIVEALVQSLTVSAESSWQGFVMHVLSSALFLLITYVFYRLGVKKGKQSVFLIIGLALSAVFTAAVMIPLNLIFTPMYLHVPIEAVKELMLPVIIPFNLIKCAINAALSFMIFVPLEKILKKSRLVSEN